MTPDEAERLIRDAVMGPDGEPVGRTWADLGAGSGTFTFALASLLGSDGRVIAVDREPAALQSLRDGLADPGADASRPAGSEGGALVVPAPGDFREPDAIGALRSVALDGALFANALHFDPDPGVTLRAMADRLAPGGRLVVIEYQDRPPNPWVPHPLPVARLAEAAEREGLGAPEVVSERPSSYGGHLYCAWLSPD